MVISLLLGPTLKNLLSYDYRVYSKMKFHLHSISPFFSTPGFATFRNREIATGAGAIREQLADLDLRIIIDNSVVEWKELEDEGYSGDEWEGMAGTR